MVDGGGQTINVGTHDVRVTQLQQHADLGLRRISVQPILKFNGNRRIYKFGNKI
jgi:hypothetical protein